MGRELVMDRGGEGKGTRAPGRPSSPRAQNGRPEDPGKGAPNPGLGAPDPRPPIRRRAPGPRQEANVSGSRDRARAGAGREAAQIPAPRLRGAVLAVPAPPRPAGPDGGHVTAVQVSGTSGGGRWLRGSQLGLGLRLRLRLRQARRGQAMASSSASSATLPGATAPPGPGFGFASKTKKKHFVQQKVKVFRAADPLVGVFLWGVAHSINELSQVPPPVMLLPDDFKASSKIKVNNHLFHRENLPSHFKFKEYCPQVFRNLRDRFGIDDQDYQISLTRSPPSESEGSDGRFLVSYDRTLVIKEVSSEDIADMHSNLSNYHQYIVKCHGNTLLPQFLGMYRVSVDNEDSYMLVMRNMFSHRLPVHRKYDLKGSLVSREASDKEKVKELPTLKDMDFLNKNQKVYIGEEEKRVFLEKLKRDVEFLVQLKIMDYSLLLGIHDIVRGTEPEEEGLGKEEEQEGEGDCGLAGPPTLVGSCGTSPEGIGGYIQAHRPLGPGEFESFIDVYAIRSAEGAPQKEVYFMGLIDILTQYDAKKKAAHAAKTVKHGAGAEISTVHPDQYAKRFLDFITNIFA